jgi:hypothetical protein
MMRKFLLFFENLGKLNLLMAINANEIIHYELNKKTTNELIQFFIKIN